MQSSARCGVAALPLDGFQMPLDVARGLEAGEDQAVLEASDDVFDDLGLLGVGGAAADDRVEDLDQVEDVLVDLGAGGAAKVEEVEELDLEADALAADHDVVVVDVAVVLAAGVDGADAAGEGVEDVERLEGGEAAVGLAGEELAELFAFDQFGDDDDDLAALDVGRLLVVVLHQ